MWAVSVRNGRGEWQQITESLGRLYERGAEVDWDGFDNGYARQRVALPSYPFQRQRYWIDTSHSPPRNNSPRLVGGAKAISQTLWNPLKPSMCRTTGTTNSRLGTKASISSCPRRTENLGDTARLGTSHSITVPEELPNRSHGFNRYAVLRPELKWPLCATLYY